MRVSKDVEIQSAVKSVGNAIRILTVVADYCGPISLKEIASRAGVAPSKAHRYVQSLCACDVLSQASRSGAYDLGLAALRLGLAAVNRVDVVNRAGDNLASLGDALGADVFLTVWSDLGPTVVRFERSAHPSLAMIGPGVAFPLLTSATGLAFLAFADRAITERAVAREVDAASGLKGSNAVNLDAELKKIRAAGYAVTSGSVLYGRQCVSAPILSLDDHIVAAVTFVTLDPASARPGSPQIAQLLDFCRRHSTPKRFLSDETLIERKIAV